MTNKTYEKTRAHKTDTKKVNILAEFETSARQLPMKCPVSQKYISDHYWDALQNVNGRTSGALENL